MKIETKIAFGTLFFGISIILLGIIGKFCGLDFFSSIFGSVWGIWIWFYFEYKMEKIIKTHYKEKEK
jgi:hypothetical protein